MLPQKQKLSLHCSIFSAWLVAFIKIKAAHHSLISRYRGWRQSCLQLICGQCSRIWVHHAAPGAWKLFGFFPIFETEIFLGTAQNLWSIWDYVYILWHSITKQHPDQAQCSTHSLILHDAYTVSPEVCSPNLDIIRWHDAFHRWWGGYMRWMCLFGSQVRPDPRHWTSTNKQTFLHGV